MPDKFYITTPIYYVNARPHIGHAYSTIVADVLARRHRLLGDDTFFLTGTDEHGQKVERSASAAGIPPQQFTDEVSATFRDLWKRMGITNDDYIRTTEPRHKQGVQKLWKLLEERGAIYLSTYTGQYCISDEAFVDVQPGANCPDCGRLTETLTEENYFFKLSEYQDRLIELIESNKLHIQPESARNEVLSFIRGGLKDLSISRTSFTWGIPVPGNEKHVIYVWLDALANYITALGYGSDDETLFEKYWPADIHLVGKEITRFHCVYWPAFLLAAGLPTPKSVVANGWLLFQDSSNQATKMSKSKGNVVRAETILDAFGEHVYKKQFPDSTKEEQDLFATDVLRYFLIREIPFGRDGNFSFDSMVTRYNADLANGYGNLVSRVLSMIVNYCDDIIPISTEKKFTLDDFKDWTPPEREDDDDYGSNPEPYGFNLESLGEYDETAYTLKESLRESAYYIASTDRYISDFQPWRLAKQKDEQSQTKLGNILYSTANSIRFITARLYPFMPYATACVWAQLGLGDIERAAKTNAFLNDADDALEPGTKLGPLAPIFPRAPKELAQIMTDMEAANIPNPEKSVSSVSSVVSPSPEPAQDTNHPAAGPRTAAFTEPNPGASVAQSNALTTERVHTPHTEAAPSGIFAADKTDTAIPQTVPFIGIDDFLKVDLRVAQILVAERIPKADKLLRLEVDLGYEKRQILSGIAEWYTPEELVGRRIVIVANLAPRKMRGLESHGMLLAASAGENTKPILTTFGQSEDIALGSRVR